MKRFLLTAVLALCALDASAANFTFSRPVRLTTNFAPQGAVAIGDANGDGRKDLAVTREMFFADGDGSIALLLYLQRADGTLAAPLTLALQDTYGDLPVTFVDLDKDGVPEIFVGKGGAQVHVVRLSGGVLTSTTTAAPRGCAYVATGDVDGDGNMDVACHDTQVTATIFFGDGTGGFRNTLVEATPAGTWVTPSGLKGMQLADVTGDGRLDMVVTASDVPSFFVLENNGLGGFWPGAVAYAHPWSPTGVYPSAVQVLDLDGDDVNEVITVSPDNRPNAALNVYRRKPNGYLSLSSRIPTYDSTTAMLAYDVDGDGDKELVTGHLQFHAVSVIGANGGGLQAQSRFDLPGFGNVVFDGAFDIVGGSNTLAVGDIDGDGCTDLAGMTFSGVQLLFGCEPYVSKIPVNDFDGDGFSDVLWRYGTNGGALHFEFRGAWWCPFNYCPPSVDTAQVSQALGDFDGDGTTDVFWRTPVSGANMLTLAGLFNRTLVPAGSGWDVVGAGDFDGDDRSDLFWRHSASGANTIWRSADATTQMAVAPVGNLTWKVAGNGDFNGDGKSDVLWRNTASGANQIWRSGNNLTQLTMTGVSNPAWQVAGIGDFNGDGRDDVVWRNTVSGANTIWLSANNATQMAVAGVYNMQWTIAALGDYNGDGVCDLYWRNTVTGANTIWLSANNATQQAAVPDQAYMVQVYPRP
jgi:hypothetical protein